MDRLRANGFIAGGVALAAAIVVGLSNPDRFFDAYLYGFLFWSGVTIGCLCLLLIQYLTGGRWGWLLRRLLEAGTRTLPLVVVLFLPLLFGLRHVYLWARPETVTDSALKHVLLQKSVYLNPLFFTARAVFYFALWGAIIFYVNRWSTILDGGPNLRLERRLRGLSGGGLVLMGLTITFASVDWAMSLDVRWQSTIYGILFMVGNVLAAFAIVILAVTSLREEEPMRTALDRETTHDLGKLLLAFTLLWAYIHLSQFLITWSANLPEEIPWYLRRMQGGWGVVGAMVLATQFVIPFPLLLSRGLKRNPVTLARVAAVVLVGRICDLFWVVAPAFEPHVAGPHLLDVLAFIGLGGLWLGGFARQLSRRPLLPRQEPELQHAHSA